MAEPPSEDPRSRYAERLQAHETLRDAAARRALMLSNTRGATFLALVAAAVVFHELDSPASWIAAVAGVALAAGFVAQVVAHRGARRTERREGALASVAREGLLRLDRDWDGLDRALPPAERVPEATSPDHPYARDLGVTGHASLVRLAGPVTSERGRAILRTWLLEPASPGVATSRQGAVRELAPMADLRDEVAALGRLEGPKRLDGLARFFAWAERDDATGSSAWLPWAVWGLPPVLLAGLFGYFALGWLPWWIVPALAQIVLLRRTRAWTAATLHESAAGGPPLRALAPQLELLAGRSWHDAALVALSRRLGDAEGGAHRHVARLGRLLDTAESRHNAIYAMLAPVLLLDIHLCRALDRWRRAYGASVRDWLETMGEWEALAALATLAHDHPDWAFPAFEDRGPPEVRASALGHPLLRPARCVRNDVAVGPPGTFLLVTGSNMSGKSTLLRAIGANVVLAEAGAPTCAASLRLPHVRVCTSMRVEDSLEEGISLFMAELLRIKGVVEAADRAARSGDRVLYLLDEILHGTNTAERRIAARGVVRHLLSTGAIGAVSTHDLTLADAPDLLGAAHSVHFREDVSGDGDGRGGTRLTFDYRLREGIATTRNALKMLDAVGLGGLELEPDGS